MKDTNHIRLSLLIIALILSSCRLFSQHLSGSEAVDIAAGFINSSRSNPLTGFKLTDSAVSANKTLIYQIKPGHKGFVLVSADKRVKPILAYSLENDFDFKTLPEHINDWIETYISQIKAITSDTSGLNPAEHPEWREINSKYRKAKTVSAAPLAISRWNQGSFYNDSCPADPAGPNGKTYAGCVPIAMAQLIYYHRSPANGTGFHSYNSNNYGLLKADFGNTAYNYDAMLVRPDRHNRFLPQLVYHCGVAVEASYSPLATGAEPGDVPAALSQYFGFADNAQLYNKNAFTDSAWKAMLRNNIDSLRPLIYNGKAGWLGHAWICDGYEEDYFHFNWGWGGYSDGYYYLSNLSAGGYNFTGFQTAIFNLIPPPSEPLQVHTISSASGTICNAWWPKNDPAQYISTRFFNPGQGFTAFQLIPDLLQLQTGDTIFIYEGNIPEGQPAYTITSESDNAGFHFNSGNICLVSVTNSGAARWAFSYLANNGSLCPQNAVLRNVTGSIFDGSGNFLMMPGSECSWRIEPQSTLYDSITAIRITAPIVDLMPGDTLFYYDGPTEQHPVLAFFTGGQVPEVFESTGNKLLVKSKVSQNSLETQGFYLTYISIYPEYCKGEVSLTARDGTISNGSNGYNYHNNSLCQWLIEVPDSEGITFTFTSLDTEQNRDRIEFYNASTNPETLMKLVSGNQLPEPFTIKGKKIRVLFRSDYSVVGKGFDMNYHSETVGFSEKATPGFKVYPNPAEDQLRLVLPAGVYVTSEAIQIFDVFGREINALPVLISEGSVLLDVGSLKSGLYILTMNTSEKSFVQRFLKK